MSLRSIIDRHPEVQGVTGSAREQQDIEGGRYSASIGVFHFRRKLVVLNPCPVD